MGLRGLSFGPERTDYRPERGLGGGRTDGRTDVRTYGRTSGNSPLCPTGHRPFGAAAQKRGDRDRTDLSSFLSGFCSPKVDFFYDPGTSFSHMWRFASIARYRYFSWFRPFKMRKRDLIHEYIFRKKLDKGCGTV